MNQEIMPIENSLLDIEAWEEWKQHRKEIRKPVKSGSLTEKKQQKLLCRFSFSDQRQIIDQSITQGWMGLFPPRDNASNNIPTANGLQVKNTASVDFKELHTNRSWADGLQ